MGGVLRSRPPRFWNAWLLMIVVVRLVEVIHTNCMSVVSLWVVSFVVRKWSRWPIFCGNIALRNASNLYLFICLFEFLNW